MSVQELHFAEAKDFLASIPFGMVDLVCTDPPYFGIVGNKWDNRWESEADFGAWFLELCKGWFRVLKPTGSLVFFAATPGAPKGWVVFEQLRAAKEAGFHFRNAIVWGKRRAYGKANDYLFTREEIFWLSKDPEKWTFNVPLLNQKRVYAGFNKDYPAKSEYLRVSNVWTDINELFRPRRVCEKPVGVMERLILTHSNRGDLVLDSFAGTGVTGVACKRRGRDFLGSDLDPLWVKQGQKDIDEAPVLGENEPIERAKVVDNDG